MWATLPTLPHLFLFQDIRGEDDVPEDRCSKERASSSFFLDSREKPFHRLVGSYHLRDGAGRRLFSNGTVPARVPTAC